MSNLPVQQTATARSPYVLDAAYRQHVLERDAKRLARSSFLPEWLRMKNGHPRPVEEIEADCLVIGMTATDLGIPFNLVTLQKMPVIKGSVDVMAQLLMGLVSARGHDCWVEERTMDHAIVCLKNSRTGRTHRVEYTLAEAQKTPQYNSNPTWKSNPADLLIARAIRRAVRIGAPEVLATFPDEPLEHVSVDPETGEVLGREVASDPPAIVASVKDEVAAEHAPPEAVAAVKGIGRRFILLDRKARELPPEWYKALRLAWKAKGLPDPDSDEFGPEHLDAAEEVVEAITAQALGTPERGISDDTDMTSDEFDRRMNRAVSADVTNLGGSTPAPSTGSANKTHVETVRLGGSPDRPRPLAEQIAIQAQNAGVDHHHVIAAVTKGAKTSAKTVTTEEGRRVLEAIWALDNGYVVLVERDGGWHLDDPPEAQALFGPGEEPFE